MESYIPYRVEHGEKVYEYVDTMEGYVYIGDLMGRSLPEFLIDRMHAANEE